MRVCFPCGMIAFISLITPHRPILPRSARKQFKKWLRTTRLNNLVLFIRLARMLALARRQQIHLPPPGREGACVLAAHAEQDKLGYVAEIVSDAAAIGA